MAKILGIDLGTTNSAMAYVEGGQPKILENKEGGRTTPSVVALSRDNERLVGVLAKRQAVTNPDNTIFSVKRLIGRRFQDPEVQRDKTWFPYQIREAANGGVELKMGEKWHTPQEISAMILSKLRADAEARFGEKITDVVITVPAYFDDSQRKATKDAGEIAGFNVKRIINEPTAAALAYGLDKKKDEQIVVYDFGGGTFDVSVLEISQDTIEVKATGGDTHLGGDDFDQLIIDWIAGEFKKDQGVDLSQDRMAVQRLKEAAEKAKHELSSVPETEINIPFVTSDASGPKHLLLKLSRAKLQELVGEKIQRAEKIVRDVVKDAGFSMQDIDEVVMVGGQTRMPAIQESVKKLFSKEPHTGINPDEVVAIGAAVQSGILGGDVQDVLLLDVIPLSLGIETLGGVSTKIIEKNTTIPVSKTQIFSTAQDGQPQVEIHVLQGEREMSQDNKTLGRFILDGIPSSPRGVPQIDVVFDIDANGILDVTAKDKATGKNQSIRIEASSGLSREEIERMKKDAEVHAEEDRAKRELVDVKNNAETLLYTTEKTLKDAGEKVSQNTRKEIEAKIEELKKVKDGQDVAAIRRALDALSSAVQKAGAELYQTAGKQEKQAGTAPEGGEPRPDAGREQGAQGSTTPEGGEQPGREQPQQESEEPEEGEVEDKQT